MNRKLDTVQYGPNNPHPLSTLRTELVWEGKYDEFGNRREVDVAGMAMPLQKIETVDEPRARTEAQGMLFDVSSAHLDDFRNMLLWGDNKLVTASLLKEFRGAIDLIYIDPPFDVGADFTMKVAIGDKKESVQKDQSTLEMVAYRDTWGKGADSYLHLLCDRLFLMRDLLCETGTIYVHCDWRVGAYIRLVMEDVFGKDNFVNEIVWAYEGTGSPSPTKLASKHDTIFRFAKNIGSIKGHKLWFEHEIDKSYSTLKQDEKGYFRIQGLGDYSEKSIADFEAEGRIYHTSKGTRYLKHRVEERGGKLFKRKKLSDVWTDITQLGTAIQKEKLDFPTQKPEKLLSRIMEIGTEEGDLVADFFCGSGTTGAVAERLGRRWIMADLGRFAVHTSRKRLIEMQRRLHAEGQSYRAFDIFNLGRYERQWWQKQKLKHADIDHRRVVLEFYRAEMLSSPPSPLLHGRKGQSLCHVDGIDSILTRKEINDVARATKEAGAKEVTCLAWEFEMDLRMECNRLEKELDIKIKLIQIPREIMEKNRTEPPPFLEVATLEAEPVFKTRNGNKIVDIRLTKFLPSLAEVPTKELEVLQERAIKSGFDFIDFWAVDFEFSNGGPFNHHWQDYRTRKDRSLKTISEQQYEYPNKGRYTACVKVVDIFGCDTSISVDIDYA